MSVSASSQKKPSKKAGSPRQSTSSSKTVTTNLHPAKPLRSVPPETNSQTETQSSNETLSTANESSESHIHSPASIDQHHAAAASSNQTLTHFKDEHHDIFLQMLVQGLSPMTFCKKFNYNIKAYHNSRLDNTDFDLKVRQVLFSLSDNVASRLYLTAMEGNVSAMTSWLKLRPPLDWIEDQQIPIDNTNMEKLSDDELINLARIRGVEVPTELETDSD